MNANQNSLNGRSKPDRPCPSCRRDVDRVKRRTAPAGVGWALALALAAPFIGAGAFAAGAFPGADAPACRTVRFSDVGWTDVTATTALTTELLRDIGYTPTVTVLSVPVTFASLQNKDIDVFLGNWMPTQEADRRPYEDNGSVVVVGPNLVGAKYTLAVPAYTYDAGLKDFSDIHRFAAALNNSIYGIEPGNDGNRLILTMLKQDQFGLGDFKLIESSEQGMLAQVERAFAAKQPIVFLAWDPHPMNMRFDLKYLNGGDQVFGPNFGGTVIYTLDAQGLQRRMPQRRTPAHEPQIFTARRERNDGGDPGPPRAARGRRGRMVEGRIPTPPRHGSTACSPSTAGRHTRRWRAAPDPPARAASNNGSSATNSRWATPWPPASTPSNTTAPSCSTGSPG